MARSALDDYYKIPISEVMKTSGYAVVDRGIPIMKVMELLCDFGHIWVVDDMKSMRVVGVIARKDFLSIAAPSGFIEDGGIPARVGKLSLAYKNVLQTADDMMTKGVSSINSDATVIAATEIMTKDVVRQLPVLEKGRLVGEVSLRDLIVNYVQFYKYARPVKSNNES